MFRDLGQTVTITTIHLPNQTVNIFLYVEQFLTPADALGSTRFPIYLDTTAEED